MSDSGLALVQICAAMQARGVIRLFAKHLSPNDNSKNQIYLGGDFRVLNDLPAGEPVAGTTGKHAKPIFKAPLRLEWLDDSGRTFPAPNAQLILYPQYPEVRMSGFLLGAQWSPNDLLTVRDDGRVLLLGVTEIGKIIGYAAGASSAVANELRALRRAEPAGVLQRIPLRADDDLASSRARLLSALCRVSREGWISGWRLRDDGGRLPCTAQNCVGVTLESELGITANGRSEPDFDGWEVKAHTVDSFAREGSGAVTLMTPEPNGGAYAKLGAIDFVQRYGYVDKRGREARMNFGGVHRVGERCEATGLTMIMDGYDASTGKIARADGVLALLDDGGTVAASWTFAGMLAHWSRKHARAVFVPALKRSEPNISYCYGASVLLAEGTDYALALKGFADGTIYYDPGIKVEGIPDSPVAKKRSQFRVARRKLVSLYHGSAVVDSCAGG